MIAKAILPLVKAILRVSVSVLITDICVQYGYQESYAKERKAKQKALVKLFRDWDDTWEIVEVVGDITTTGIRHWIHYLCMRTTN